MLTGLKMEVVEQKESCSVVESEPCWTRSVAQLLTLGTVSKSFRVSEFQPSVLN